jgi:hypothetical protein
MHGIFSARVTRDRNLPACNRPAAQNADALIIERMPSSTGITGLEDSEAFFWKEVEMHIGQGCIQSEERTV